MTVTTSEVVTAEAVDAATDAIIGHMGRITRLLTNREHARYVASLALLAAAPHIAAAERDRIRKHVTSLQGSLSDYEPAEHLAYGDILMFLAGR